MPANHTECIHSPSLTSVRCYDRVGAHGKLYGRPADEASGHFQWRGRSRSAAVLAQHQRHANVLTFACRKSCVMYVLSLPSAQT